MTKKLQLKQTGLLLSVLLLLSFPALATDYCDDANCQGCWKMEVDEDPITDDSGETNHGDLKGANEPDFASASPPNAGSAGYYVWDGADDVINCGSDAELDNISPLSSVAWANPDTAGEGDQGRFFDKGGETIWQIDDDGVETDTICFFRDNGTYLRRCSADNTVAYSSWHHYAMTWDGVFTDRTGILFYKDGTETTYSTGQDGVGSPGSDASASFLIGNFSTGVRTYDGSLDEFAVFDDVLTSTEINDIMDNGLDGTWAAARRFMIISQKEKQEKNL